MIQYQGLAGCTHWGTSQLAFLPGSGWVFPAVAKQAVAPHPWPSQLVCAHCTEPGHTPCNRSPHPALPTRTKKKKSESLKLKLHLLFFTRLKKTYTVNHENYKIEQSTFLYEVYIISAFYVACQCAITWAMLARSWENCLTMCNTLRTFSSSVRLEQDHSHSSLCIISVSWNINRIVYGKAETHVFF